MVVSESGGATGGCCASSHLMSLLLSVTRGSFASAGTRYSAVFSAFLLLSVDAEPVRDRQQEIRQSEICNPS
jgi:hypothetical protein